jgi:outer membrane protein
MLGTLIWNSPAAAQDEDAPRRTRVGLGAQLVPSYPGADSHIVIPLFDLSRARGDEAFDFEAPDESFGFALVNEGGFAFGPALGFEGSRTAKDVGAALDKVDATIEAGAFAQYEFSPAFRARVEARRGIGGHEGWTGSAGADYVARDEDKYLFSIGPRVTWSDARYHRAYFGVTPAEAARTGLAAFRPQSGVQAVGAAASFLAQLSRRWGIYSYAKYDRLVGDAGRSPVVGRHGSRDQLSGGVALTYTFGKN